MKEIRPISGIPYIARAVKRSIQRKFRKSGCADDDLFCLDIHMAPMILKKLRAFKDYIDITRPEWEDYPEDFEEAGGMDAWMEALNEMIFAFDYNLYQAASKNEILICLKDGS